MKRGEKAADHSRGCWKQVSLFQFATALSKWKPLVCQLSQYTIQNVWTAYLTRLGCSLRISLLPIVCDGCVSSACKTRACQSADTQYVLRRHHLLLYCREYNPTIRLSCSCHGGKSIRILPIVRISWMLVDENGGIELRRSHLWSYCIDSVFCRLLMVMVSYQIDSTFPMLQCSFLFLFT